MVAALDGNGVATPSSHGSGGCSYRGSEEGESGECGDTSEHVRQEKSSEVDEL